ncbi:MAG TPA: PAS domain-containing protein, partial [Longimicrobium sp.]|nr:PAS domain-containing protein [Longimicrobium sp.]
MAPRTEQLTALLDQVVPALADWCVIDVLDDDGLLSRRAARTADPAKAERVAELLRGPGLDLNAPRGAARAFRTGVPQLCPQLDASAQGYLGPLGVVRKLGAAQCIAVPLSASGTSLGVLSLVRGEGRPPFSLSELAQAEGLCRRWLNGDGNADDGVNGLGARAEELVESTSDAFFALDRRGTVVYMNRRAEVLTGRERAGLLGKSIWDAFPPAIGTLFHREYHRTLEDQTPSEYVDFYPPLKAWFEVRAFPSVHGLYVFFRDVTPRLRAEEERKHLIESLEAERRQVQEVLQQLP